MSHDALCKDMLPSIVKQKERKYIKEHSYPTDPFKTLELKHPSHDASELQRIRLSPDLEAPNL